MYHRLSAVSYHMYGAQTLDTPGPKLETATGAAVTAACGVAPADTVALPPLVSV